MSGPAFDQRVSCVAWGRSTVTFRLRAWPDERVAVATELAENPGPSVTNAAEDVWPFVVRTLALVGHEPGEWRHVEHYDDAESYGARYEQRPPRLDEVTLTGGGVQWAPLPADLEWLREALA